MGLDEVKQSHCMRTAWMFYRPLFTKCAWILYKSTHLQMIPLNWMWRILYVKPVLCSKRRNVWRIKPIGFYIFLLFALQASIFSTCDRVIFSVVFNLVFRYSINHINPLVGCICIYVCIYKSNVNLKDKENVRQMNECINTKITGEMAGWVIQYHRCNSAPVFIYSFVHLFIHSFPSECHLKGRN